MDQITRIPVKYLALLKTQSRETVGKLCINILGGSDKLNENETILFNLIMTDVNNINNQAKIGRRGGRPKTNIIQHKSENNKPQVINLKTNSYGIEKPNENENTVLFGKFVKMTDIEYGKLCDRRNKKKVDDMIEDMNIYCSNHKKKGKVYENYYMALIKWIKKKEDEKVVKTKSKRKPLYTDKD